MSSHGRCGCLWDSPHLACAWCGNCCHLRKIYAILVVKPALWESMRYVCGGRIIQQFLCGGKWHPFAWCQMRKEISQELLMLSVWLMIVRWQRLSRTQASSSEKCNQCLNGWSQCSAVLLQSWRHHISSFLTSVTGHPSLGTGGWIREDTEYSSLKIWLGRANKTKPWAQFYKRINF